MSKESVQWIEMVRLALAKREKRQVEMQSPGAYLFCESCGHDTRFDLVDERGGWEIYRCQSCGGQKSYRVG